MDVCGGDKPALHVGQVDGSEPTQALDEEKDRIGQLGGRLGNDVIDIVDPQDGGPEKKIQLFGDRLLLRLDILTKST
jgi:hypothetical protein